MPESVLKRKIPGCFVQLHHQEQHSGKFPRLIMLHKSDNEFCRRISSHKKRRARSRRKKPFFCREYGGPCLSPAMLATWAVISLFGLGFTMLVQWSLSIFPHEIPAFFHSFCLTCSRTKPPRFFLEGCNLYSALILYPLTVKWRFRANVPKGRCNAGTKACLYSQFIGLFFRLLLLCCVFCIMVVCRLTLGQGPTQLHLLHITHTHICRLSYYIMKVLIFHCVKDLLHFWGSKTIPKYKKNSHTHTKCIARHVRNTATQGQNAKILF